jgi:hypothetical protein
MKGTVPSRITGARITWTWALLSALTVLSWGLAATRGFSPDTALTIVVLAIAAVKTRLVIRQFMDVRGGACLAPPRHRRLARRPHGGHHRPVPAALKARGSGTAFAPFLRRGQKTITFGHLVILSSEGGRGE